MCVGTVDSRTKSKYSVQISVYILSHIKGGSMQTHDPIGYTYITLDYFKELNSVCNLAG